MWPSNVSIYWTTPLLLCTLSVTQLCDDKEIKQLFAVKDNELTVLFKTHCYQAGRQASNETNKHTQTDRQTDTLEDCRTDIRRGTLEILKTEKLTDRQSDIFF